MMKNALLPFILVLFALSSVVAQSGATYDFNDGDVSGWGSSTSLLSETSFGGSVLITANGVGNGQQNSFFIFGESLDLEGVARLSFRAKSKQVLTVRVDLIDAAGNATNASPISKVLKERGEWNSINMNFNSKLFTDASLPVDAKSIAGVLVYLSTSSGNFTGDVLIDDLQLGTQAVAGVGNGIPGIKLNQLGFSPNSTKIAIVSSSNETSFELLNAAGDAVFSGPLGELEYWSMADDSVRVADFSSFSQEADGYRLSVANLPKSAPFSIKEQPFFEASKAAIKAYYLNRASTELLPEHVGVFAREAGHPDTRVLVHSSAADALRPEGTVISAPKGWYDAGDYNKYIVNSGISTYTLMSLYEHFPQIYDTLDLNIPESGNSLPDLLDEVKWNLDWMLAMQDPNDGGVYFKLTSKNFTASILPAQDFTERYVVKKSTTSALNFAAVMAVAYRVFKPFENELPGYADNCLRKAIRAYEWAIDNPNVRYNNPADIQTGEYGDGRFTDEYSWSSTELYIATNNDEYYSRISFLERNDIPTWFSVSGLGFVSLSHYLDDLTDVADTEAIKARLRRYVADHLAKYQTSAYRMPMGSRGRWEFNWGSNSHAANTSLMLLQDYYNTNEEASFEGALANVDYLLGRNPLEFCFVTGFGTNSPQDPHHRPSEADGIAQPQPGFLVGGPNDNSAGESNCNYESSLPALEYIDAQCSFSTNEIAINWNAPLSFVLGAVNAASIGEKPTRKSFVKGSPVGLLTKINNDQLVVFPNPANGFVSFNLTNGSVVEKVSVLNLNGNVVINNSNEDKIDTSSLEDGVYYLQVSTNKGMLTRKIVVQR